MKPRSAARWITASPSPGRRRIVMRSVAATCCGLSGDSRRSHTSSRSRRARIAFEASADSDRPTCCASNLKRAFSSVEGRTVIDGIEHRARRLLRARSRASSPTFSAGSCVLRSLTLSVEGTVASQHCKANTIAVEVRITLKIQRNHAGVSFMYYAEVILGHP